MSDPSASSDDADQPAHAWARMGARTGSIAVGLAAGGPWTCGLTFWLATPAALLALWMARLALIDAEPRSATRAYAKMTVVTGVLALSFSLLYFASVGLFTLWFFSLILLGL